MITRKPLSRFVAILMTLTCSLPAWAQTNADEITVKDLLESAHNARVRVGYIGAAIGASILVVPLLSNTATRTDKLLFSLAGITVLLGGIKGIVTASQSELLLQEMQDLRTAGKLSPEAENALLAQMADSARAERYWGAGSALVGGAVSIASGANVSDPSLKNFTLILGSLSMLSGVMLLARPTKLEKYKEEKALTWGVAPAVFFARGAVPGLGAHFAFGQ